MREPIDLNRADEVIELFQAAAAALRAQPSRRGCAVRLPARGRLIATGDLHDNTFHLQKIIAAARLDASPDHHVILHELIHGERMINDMDFSYRMLAKVAQLVVTYPTQVHPLLANHEISQLTRTGVSKGAGNSVVRFNEALEYVFQDEWEVVAEALDELFRAMPLALISEGGVFCAHSIPNEKLMPRIGPDLFERELRDEDFKGALGAAYLMTWGRAHSPAQMAAFAEAMGVRLLVLGHRHVEMGAETQGERCIILNSDHERGVLLPLDLANVPDAPAALAQVRHLETLGGAAN